MPFDPKDFPKLTQAECDALNADLKAAAEKPTKVAALEAAVADLEATKTLWYAELSAAQVTCNQAQDAINAAYAGTLAAKEKAVEDAKAALETTALTAVEKVG